MRVLGIDPGTITMGYGILDSNGDELELVDYGALNVSGRSPIGERLSYLYRGIMKSLANFTLMLWL